MQSRGAVFSPSDHLKNTYQRNSGCRAIPADVYRPNRRWKCPAGPSQQCDGPVSVHVKPCDLLSANTITVQKQQHKSI